MAFSFEIHGRLGPARAGRLLTAHGAVETPVFMPVGTLANVKGVPQDLLEDLGVEVLLSNTYHLYLRPGAEQIRQMGGLHRFMSWPRAILTDSGGYQVFSLSDLRTVSEEGVAFRSHLDGSPHFMGPESSIAAQIALGADIIMAFDECTEHPADRQRTRASMELTLRWAERSQRYFEENKHEVPWLVAHGRGPTTSSVSSFEFRAANGYVPSGHSKPETRNSANDERPTNNDSASGRRPSTIDDLSRQPSAVHCQALFGIVQGGMYPDLRRESAERTVELDFPGYAIGGLSVGEPRTMTQEIVSATVPYLPADRPRYLMGVGTPEEIAQYAAMGVDMMDCVLPTRAARHGLLFTSAGRISIKQARYAQDEGPLDPRCHCRVCARYSRAYLRHLYAANEVLAMVLNTIHNLAYYLDTMRAVRHAIKLGEWAFLSGVGSTPKP
ncbi:MAG TPA: tRNA guanosine(34) transglycosylase Tgt [Terriglobales bacterium]|nr:tRNA guanosine(34) transglycosylase Tgt [Terriglobales bacterium]